MRPVRIGAEWAWTSTRFDGLGAIAATYPDHPNTGKTQVRFDTDSEVWGWRFNSTVRAFTHEILMGLVLQYPGGGEPDFLACWLHHSFEPGGSTRNREVVALPRKPFLAPAGSLLWAWVDGWGQQYGPPGAHATVIELQATIFVEGDTSVLGAWGGSPLL